MPNKTRGRSTGNAGARPAEARRISVREVPLEGEVARLTLDRPEHNLLNERMLAELAAGIITLGERQRNQADGPRFGGESFLRRHRARRIHAAARLSDAGRVSRRILRDAGYVEAAAGGRERPGFRRRRGTGGARRSGDRHSQRAIRAAGNQAGRFSAARCGDSSLHRWGRSTRSNWCSPAKR